MQNVGIRKQGLHVQNLEESEQVVEENLAFRNIENQPIVMQNVEGIDLEPNQVLEDSFDGSEVQGLLGQKVPFLQYEESYLPELDG